MIEALLYLAGGVVLLTFGADGLVRGSSALALRLGMAPLIVGLTVVAFGTSAPELVASLAAASAGSTDMALGNVVGSNISNIALVLGLAAIIRPISIQRQITRRDAPLAFGLSGLLVLLLIDGQLGRLEGAFLFSGIIVYSIWSIRDARQSKKTKPAHLDEVDLESVKMPIWKDLLFTLAGLAGLIAGAKLFVDGGQSIARLYGISEAVIGLTVMAIGTSLPEVATVVMASIRGMSDLITGNVIGSNIFNILSVLGASALIIPLSMGELTSIDLIVFLASALVIWLMMMSRHELSRWEGALLLVGYVGYIVYLVFT
jgi:cation:H+ antiporter